MRGLRKNMTDYRQEKKKEKMKDIIKKEKTNKKRKCRELNKNG